MQSAETAPRVAIACGGTGGHLFPGLAVADVLAHSGCSVSLLISPKEVDQQAVKSAARVEVLTLPAVGLVNGNLGAFVRGFWRSCCAARQMFKVRTPQAVLAMGGFTSAPPVLAGQKAGAATFLHESNSIPGRANRWLAPLVDAAFTGFPSAARRLHCQTVKFTGTPVRTQFHSMDAAGCRVALGLNADRPVLLVMGGSQGARGVNQLITRSLPLLTAQFPALQFAHLTGTSDFESVRDIYATHRVSCVVRPFLSEMELALGAATVAVSRAGASSQAELAAMRVPSILIPYPGAADNHQFYNAWAFVESGAARMLEQEKATPEMLVEMIRGLVEKSDQTTSMKEALAKWHQPDAAEQIAGRILEAMARNGARVGPLVTAGGESAARLSDSGNVGVQAAQIA
ncbi:MAG TPA: undecaprenyldiphospho-muramoylpentapeptide beta-N-acetylglucosaminyltransferase [Candidatus Angelobacter sp.]|nr:undecaprenyldiphospho-muramoylpentapeptide beta-N-acetylglucosaminyltransferase [Candidatus Angelobacter sp.]